MKKIIRRIRNWWHDPRAEFSREVHQKERDQRYQEREQGKENFHLFI